VRVPVLTVQSETDVVGLGSAGARQDDAERFRLWEIAGGGAHGDTYLLVASAADDGSLAPAELARLLAPTDNAFGMQNECADERRAPAALCAQAALAHLERWADGGVPPPEAPRLVLGQDDRPLALDELGIAKGGIRSPWVDAPTAVLSGLGQSGAEFASLFGTTRAFGAAGTRSPLSRRPRGMVRAFRSSVGRRWSRAASCSKPTRPRSAPSQRRTPW
jgi:hypothetical protein